MLVPPGLDARLARLTLQAAQPARSRGSLILSLASLPAASLSLPRCEQPPLALLGKIDTEILEAVGEAVARDVEDRQVRRAR